VGPRGLTVFAFETGEGWGWALCAHGRGSLAAGSTHPFCMERKPLFTILYLYMVSMYINSDTYADPRPPTKCTHGGRAPGAGLSHQVHPHSGPNLKQTPISPPFRRPCSQMADSLGLGTGGSQWRHRLVDRQTPGFRVTSTTTSSISQSRPAAPVISLGGRGCCSSSDFALIAGVNTSRRLLQGPQQRA